MRCKQVEKIFIDASESELDKRTKAEIEQHVLSCQRCQSFAKSLNWMRSELKQFQIASPADKLLQQTRSLCYDELRAKAVISGKAGMQMWGSPTPKFVWVALVAILVLTQVLVFPLFTDTTENQIISFPGIMALILVIQNITMLISAPLLLRKFKIRNGYAKLV